MNHTPGPWKLWRGPQYVGGGEDICIGAGDTWLANMDHRYPRCENVYARDHNDDECDICTIDSGEITAEQLANANLIAAAPELLAVCEQFVHAYDSLPETSMYDVQLVARAAILKAKGD